MSPDPSWVQINLDLLTDKQVQVLLETNAAALALFLRLLRDDVQGEPFKSYDPVDEDPLLCLHQVGIVIGSVTKGYHLAPEFLKRFTRPAATPSDGMGIKIPTSQMGINVGINPPPENGAHFVSLGNFVHLAYEQHPEKMGINVGTIEKRTLISNVITKRVIKNKEKKESKKAKKPDGNKNSQPAQPELEAGDVKDCLDVFLNEVQSRFGFKPAIGTASIVTLRRFLKKHGAERTVKVIRFYVGSEKAASLGCTLAHAFTEHTINLMQQTEVNGNGRQNSGPAARTRGNYNRRDNRTPEPSRVDKELDEEVERINARRRARETKSPTSRSIGSGEGAGRVLSAEANYRAQILGDPTSQPTGVIVNDPDIPPDIE